MNESYKKAESNEVILTIEEAEANLIKARKSLEESAFAIGRYEEGNDEADFGFKDDHEKNMEAAEEAFRDLLKAVEVKGKKDGELAAQAAQQGNLPL